MAGVLAGGSIGAALGKRIEGSPELLEKGDAFDFLYAAHSKNPKVANAGLVQKALEQEITSYDKNDDGRRWYTKQDLEEFLRSDGPTKAEVGPLP